MSGITRAERERRDTEEFLATVDRPYRDAQEVVCFVGRAERAYCAPCRRRSWGVQIRIGGGHVHRCIECLDAIAEQIAAGRRRAIDRLHREAARAITEGEPCDAAPAIT